MRKINVVGVGTPWLNPREKVFIDSYIAHGFKIDPALKQARIPRKQAWLLMKTPKFKAYMQRWLDRQHAQAGILSRDDVFAEINKIASRSLADCMVTITRTTGNKTTTITRIDRALLNSKVKCLDLMARIYGMLEENKITEKKLEITYNFVSPDAAKLLKAAPGAAANEDAEDFDAEGELVN